MSGLAAAGFRALRRVRRWGLPRHVQHVSGPPAVAIGPRDVIVVSLVRDGAEHVASFVDHHLRLGARHVVLLDNGSIDETVSRAVGLDGVTVLRTALPYPKYKYLLKRYLFDRFAAQGWCLIADIDERFAYPLADSVSLTGFLTYLDRHGYTAVVAHMLDLFADGPLRSWPLDGRTLMERCRWYDLSAVERQPYASPCGSRTATPAIGLFRGGIRRLMFGVNSWLWKHPLLKGGGRARPSHDSAHDCCDARIADVSGLLLHYKFDGAFKQKCVRAVQRRNYSKGSQEYRAYLAVLHREPDLTLLRATGTRLRHVDQLLEEGFVYASEAFHAFARGGRGEDA